MGRYYVYVHKKASNGDVFYVGKGCDRRAWSKQKRTAWWVNTVKKHGLIVEIIKDALTEAEALDLEERMIAETKGLVNICSRGNETCEVGGAISERGTVLGWLKGSGLGGTTWSVKVGRYVITQSLSVSGFRTVGVECRDMAGEAVSKVVRAFLGDFPRGRELISDVF